ncbi:MAG: MFS transporter [Planctomycetota bacterium]
MGPERLRANISKVLFLNSLWMFLLIMPVIVPFLRQYGLSMEQVFQLQAIFAVCIVVFEVPSGYIADLCGRRNSLIVAGVFHGLAFTVLATSSSFSGFVVFEVLAALGQSFFSGSDVALLYDTEAALGEPERTTRILGRRLFWSQVGETVAAPIGGALVLAGLWWPAFLNAVVAWLPLLVAVTLVEPPRAKAQWQHRENFGRIFGVIFCTTPILRQSFLALVAYGLSTLLAVWVFQGYWEQLGISLWFFGFAWAGYNLIVAVTGHYAHRIEKRLGASRVVLIIGIVPIVGYLGMAACALTNVPIWIAIGGGLLFGATFQIGRGLTQVVIKAALNERVPAELRATANSLSSLGVRLLFAALGLLLGALIDVYGYPTGLGTFGAIFALAFLLVCLPLLGSIRRSST